MFDLREADLATPMLAFAIACYVLLIAWAEIRRKDVTVVAMVREMGEEERKLLQIGRHLRLLLLGAISIILCHHTLPAAYQYLIPIRALDHTYINLVGMATIFCALIWTSVIQLEFDQELFRYKAAGEEMMLTNMLAYSRKIQTGYFLIICSIAITLASVASVGISFIACSLYMNARK